MCFVYIRDPLKEANRLQSIMTSAIWIMYGHLLIEQQASAMSTDIIHNYLTNVVSEDEMIIGLSSKSFLDTINCLHSRSSRTHSTFDCFSIPYELCSRKSHSRTSCSRYEFSFDYTVDFSIWKF